MLPPCAFRGQPLPAQAQPRLCPFASIPRPSDASPVIPLALPFISGATPARNSATPSQTDPCPSKAWLAFTLVTQCNTAAILARAIAVHCHRLACRSCAIARRCLCHAIQSLPTRNSATPPQNRPLLYHCSCHADLGHALAPRASASALRLYPLPLPRLASQRVPIAPLLWRFSALTNLLTRPRRSLAQIPAWWCGSWRTQDARRMRCAIDRSP